MPREMDMAAGRTLSDSEIIRKTLAGDRRVFEVLVQRYNRMAYAVAFSRLGNHEEAKDAVQDAWVQAFKTLDRLRDTAKFGPWFAAIVRNISLNAVRNQWRRRPLDDARGIAMNDMRKTIEEADMQRALWAQVVNLTPDHREVLTLHYHAGMTAEEIAAVIHEPRETVKKRIQRARNALNDKMLRTMFEPAQRDDEQMRKRAMLAMMALPAPWENGPQAGQAAKKGATAQTGAAAMGKAFWWALGVGAVLVAGLVTAFFLWGGKTQGPQDNSVPPVVQPAPPPPQQPTPGGGKVTGKGGK